MWPRAKSSRKRFEQYVKDRRARLREKEQRGAKGSGAAEAARAETAPAGAPGGAPGSAPGGAGGPGAEQKRKRTRSFFTLFREFWRLLGEHRHVLILSLGTVTISAMVGLAMPAATKVAIDYILTNHPGPEGIPAWIPVPHDASKLLRLLALALMATACVSVFAGMWGRWQTTRLRKRVEVTLRRRAFEQAARLPLHRIHHHKSGGIASLLREDTGAAAELVFTLVYNPWRAIVQLVGTLVILTVTDWRLLLGALTLLPLIWATHRTWINRIRPVFRDIRMTRQTIDARSTEAFGGMRVVRGFGREAGEASAFVSSNHFMIRQELLAWWWSRGVDISWALLIPAASAGVLWYGGWRVLHGSLTVGDVMMFSAYLLMLLSPLETLAVSAANMQTNLAGLDRVLDLLAEAREFEGGRDPGIKGSRDQGGTGIPKKFVERAAAKGRIMLDSVSFRYPGRDEDVLKGVSLDVAPGEIIALVGPSGAGKTTLCNLVARFYDPTRGAVRFDGTDLREVDVRSYRALLGIVEQDVFLFDGTIAENIAYARPGASEEDVERAARAANADEFIDRFEKQYQTVVGERGVRLSGGQKQRIAIARAVLADPRILILDEATSNLDTESERLIQRSLAGLMRGRTCFVIAHRLSTVRHADRIVVLERGAITEVGSHDELLASGGRYAELLKLQVEGQGGMTTEGHGEQGAPAATTQAAGAS